MRQILPHVTLSTWVLIFSHFLVPVPTPIFELPPSEDHVNKKSENSSDKKKIALQLTKTPLNMDRAPQGKAYLQTHDFFIIFEGAMPIPGVSTHMMLRFKDIPKTPKKVSLLYTLEVFTVCP